MMFGQSSRESNLPLKKEKRQRKKRKTTVKRTENKLNLAKSKFGTTVPTTTTRKTIVPRRSINQQSTKRNASYKGSYCSSAPGIRRRSISAPPGEKFSKKRINKKSMERYFRRLS